jgi:regulator of replication initiation timing
MTDREWAKAQHPGLVEENQREPMPHFGFTSPRFDFVTKHFCLESNIECGKACEAIEKLFNEGWHFCNQITCRPYVLITFSRLKEITEDGKR